MTQSTSHTVASVESKDHAIAREAVSKFYDQFQPRLLSNHVHGNPRMTAAINRICARVRPSHKSLLDVGCGVGTSSAKLAELLPGLTVLGIDISAGNVRSAEKLCSSERVRFECDDLSAPPVGAPFDVIALIDVYEHIRRSDWPRFNQVLSDSLGPGGVIVITTPSPYHQRYLERYEPAGLQIVDETVMLDDILALRETLGGSLVCYEYISVWHSNDYLHVVIDRDPQYATLPAPRAGAWRRFYSSWFTAAGREVRRRRKHVGQTLGIKL